MQYDLCRHVRINGVQCQCPALRTQPYCFFHTRLAERHSAFRQAPSPNLAQPGPNLQLAPLEDRESIQVALSVVVNALAAGHLESRRATAILYGLQLASMNAVRLNLEPFAPKVVRTAPQSPEGLELADPGATGRTLTQQEIDEEQDEEEQDDDQDNDDDDDDDEIYPDQPQD